VITKKIGFPVIPTEPNDTQRGATSASFSIFFIVIAILIVVIIIVIIFVFTKKRQEEDERTKHQDYEEVNVHGDAHASANSSPVY
jgi:heme/copper-type cytochrome/quinol oxidase subunit 2